MSNILASDYPALTNNAIRVASAIASVIPSAGTALTLIAQRVRNTAPKVLELDAMTCDPFGSEWVTLNVKVRVKFSRINGIPSALVQFKGCGYAFDSADPVLAAKIAKCNGGETDGWVDAGEFTINYDSYTDNLNKVIGCLYGELRRRFRIDE